MQLAPQSVCHLDLLSDMFDCDLDHVNLLKEVFQLHGLFVRSEIDSRSALQMS